MSGLMCVHTRKGLPKGPLSQHIPGSLRVGQQTARPCGNIVLGPPAAYSPSPLFSLSTHPLPHSGEACVRAALVKRAGESMRQHGTCERWGGMPKHHQYLSKVREAGSRTETWRGGRGDGGGEGGGCYATRGCQSQTHAQGNDQCGPLWCQAGRSTKRGMVRPPTETGAPTWVGGWGTWWTN